MKDFTVLFVDDEKSILDAFRRIFLDAPVKIYISQSAKDVLDVLSLKDLDLIVTDIKMPEMHGLAFIEEIRKKNSTIPIIVYSSFAGMKDDYVIHTQNIEAFYNKPEDFDLLCQKIKEMASQKRPVEQVLIDPSYT